ncbi:DUF3768 domain-containing protein [Sphingomonas sp. PB4P5]|uniref:DUF3768 domain-containing protein n=1 Tax=Parasphingomonas puruogangriensis TaxID=3096155 RepID=UPI002FCC2D13
MTDDTGEVRPARMWKTHARVAAICALNDAFRKRGAGGMAAVTPGIKALGSDALVEITRTIREFDDFNADNDPHGEHDMGAFLYAGERVFWKIDYYDNDLEHGSPDSANSAVTTRVLTIMLASEY